MPNPAQQAQQAKIQQAQSQLEEKDGRSIKADKLSEWALLEIAQRLLGIQEQLGQISVSIEKQTLSLGRK